MIDDAAREAALEPALVHAVISVESGYNAAARSPKGAIGLMQVMPETASRYGVRDAARSPQANLKAGTLYLSDLMQLFENRLDLVLAAYNAGENAVLRYGQRIPPYRETQLYVPAVLARYFEWRESLPVAVAAPPRIQYMPGTVLDLDFLRASGHR
jgi:soluble lytic murein transglycosylase-like protein